MTVHIPILVAPIVNALTEPFRGLPTDAPSHYLVDCTLGGGGHTQAFLDAFAADPDLRRHRILSVDQDASAIARARDRFGKEIAEGRLELLHRRFGDLSPDLSGRPVLGMMADLGFSSDQLEDAGRGLSFLRDGPLDMRLDPEQGESAHEYLSHVSEGELIQVLQEYGEERFSRRIAGAIIRSRSEKKLPRTTRGLAELIERAVPPPARHGRIHAATRSFQALRILVNEELQQLDCLLERVILSVKTGGRVAILSFHSLEDRKVKQVFKNREGAFRSLTKKPIEADEEEVKLNPRSRSAKLRIAERVV